LPTIMIVAKLVASSNNFAKVLFPWRQPLSDSPTKNVLAPGNRGAKWRMVDPNQTPYPPFPERNLQNGHHCGGALSCAIGADSTSFGPDLRGLICGRGGAAKTRQRTRPGHRRGIRDSSGVMGRPPVRPLHRLRLDPGAKLSRHAKVSRGARAIFLIGHRQCMQPAKTGRPRRPQSGSKLTWRKYLA